MTVFRYSIVRYVPDPVRGEQLNVGVVAGDTDGRSFGARFLGRNQFSRLKRLGFAEDFGFIGELAEEITSGASGAQTQLLGKQREPWKLETIDMAAVEWANAIQFSELRAAEVDELEPLLDELFARYVVPPRRRRQRARDKRWVKRKVTARLRNAVAEAQRDPDDIIHQDERIAGEFDEHTFDYALTNGRLRHLVETMSFETSDRRALRTEVDAVAWAIDDVRRARSRLPITVATIGRGKILDDAQRVYESLDATVVREDDLDPWVAELAGSLV